MNGLSHPRLPIFLDCGSHLRGGGTHSSDRQSGSHSSRGDNANTPFEADVDNIDIILALTVHDTDQISITPGASNDTLTEVKSYLATVCSKRTVAKDSYSADEFILAREAVVRFVQASIAEAVNRQKRNADKNGRANILFNKAT